MNGSFNLERPLLTYLDKWADYEKTCELIYAKLYYFKFDKPKKIYDVRKRIKEGKNAKVKMMKLLKEGKKLFFIDKDDLEKLKAGNISENLKKTFNTHGYSLSNEVKPKQIKKGEWNIVDKDMTFIIKEGKVFKKIDEENVLNEITDIVGLKIICYFEEDKRYVDKLIKDLEDNGEIKILEKELHYPSNYPLSEEEKYFRLQGFKPSPEDSMYSALHYIVVLANDKDKIPIEIQAKTMFEEVFGELQHDISYKYFPTIKSEEFKIVGSTIRILDHQVEDIKKYINRKEKEIREKLGLYCSMDDETMKKVFKMMSIHQIDPDSMIRAIENIFEDLEQVFYDILSLDNDMITISLCFEYVLKRPEDIRNISKRKLVEAFFEKLDILIEKNGIEKCKGILEDLSYIPDSDITLTWLRKCRENTEVIRKHDLSIVINKMMLKVFDHTFIKKNKGLKECGHLTNLLVEVWHQIDENDRKEWRENIISYIKNSTSEESNVIISSILKIFQEHEKRLSGLDPTFHSFMSQILEEAKTFHKESKTITKVYKEIKEKRSDI